MQEQNQGESKIMKKIYVVGIGPGRISQMTKRAADAISESDVIIGYKYYMTLIKNEVKGKEIFTSPMGEEKSRCRKAVEYALSEKTISVISSGDSGVYGMASLIYEMCEKYPDIKIEVIPGVSACLSGAAVLGAPINHDFAVISLSDLLTPWEKIERRLSLASKGDFVICIYNPSSRKRADYLERACNIMLKYKKPETICGYVKNIGRKGEEYKIMTLLDLKDTKTDMFTTVIVGNSETKVINGKIVTPRGYEGI